MLELLRAWNAGKRITDFSELLNSRFFCWRPDPIAVQETVVIMGNIMDGIADCIVIIIGTVFDDQISREQGNPTPFGFFLSYGRVYLDLG